LEICYLDSTIAIFSLFSLSRHAAAFADNDRYLVDATVSELFKIQSVTETPVAVATQKRH
jgi:hypothetical protein